MTPLHKVLLVAGVFLIFLSFSLSLNQATKTLVQQVQDGDVWLFCDMPDGSRYIHPSMVTDLFEGVWQFENGYSKSCTLRVPSENTKQKF